MGKKILIVEDTEDTRDLLSLLLRDEGYTVFTANDGEEGLKLIHEERPDLIITDINMPNLDGVEFIKAVRQSPNLNALPIIVMTAYGGERLSHAIKAGADEGVRKPLDYDSFIEGIKEILSPKELTDLNG